MTVAIRSYVLDDVACFDVLERLDEHTYQLSLSKHPNWPDEQPRRLCEIAAHQWLREAPDQVMYVGR